MLEHFIEQVDENLDMCLSLVKPVFDETWFEYEQTVFKM